MNRPMMSCLLPVAEGHLRRRQVKVPTQVADHCLWRHQRRAGLADLLTSAAPPLHSGMRLHVDPKTRKLVETQLELN